MQHLVIEGERNAMGLLLRCRSSRKHAFIVVQPALNRPLIPSPDIADFMTAPQKGATSTDQSAILMSCVAATES